MHRDLKEMSCTLSGALLTKNLPLGFTPEGLLTGGPQCRLLILRNGNVPCRYFLEFPVNHHIVCVALMHTSHFKDEVGVGGVGHCFVP